jgi:hypothetical protein
VLPLIYSYMAPTSEDNCVLERVTEGSTSFGFLPRVVSKGAPGSTDGVTLLTEVSQETTDDD